MNQNSITFKILIDRALARSSTLPNFMRRMVQAIRLFLFVKDERIKRLLDIMLGFLYSMLRYQRTHIAGFEKVVDWYCLLKSKSEQGSVVMKAANFINTLRPWLDAKLGVSLDLASEPPAPVYSQTTGATPLCAMGLRERGIVTARPQWVEPLKPIVANLTLYELFSIFGGYELSRVLLPDGFSVWGPSWVYVGDSQCFRPAEDTRPVHLTPDQLDDIVDWRMFWHCFEDDAVASFGIFDDDRQLLALASVRAEHDLIWEIGMDVVPGAKGGGLGRAVVSAAGRWILEQDRLILATTAPWNVPSARTLRSVGLQFIMSIMMSMSAPYRVPPQALGSPRPDVEIYNYYPDWAINKNILSDE